MIMIKIAGLRRREPLRLMKVGEGGGAKIGTLEGGRGRDQGLASVKVFVSQASGLKSPPFSVLVDRQ